MKNLWDEAIAEAYASAPAESIILQALEIMHKNFDKPARIIRWPLLDNQPEEFLCKHESTAPYDPTQTVIYLGVPYDIRPPEKSAEQPGAFILNIDNIGTLLDSDLEAAALGGGKITAIYREFLKGCEAEGPKSVWSGLDIQSPKIKGLNLTAKGIILGWISKPFGSIYTPEKYPGLVRGR